MNAANLKACLTYIFKDVFLGIITGFKQSLSGICYIPANYDTKLDSKSSNGSHLVKRKRKSEQSTDVRTEIYKCCAYNGLFYGISVVAFSGIVYFLEAIAYLAYFKQILAFLFDILWTVPMFCILKIINIFWFQDIANSAYRHRYGRPRSIGDGGATTQFADTAYGTIVELLFLAQAHLLHIFVPYPTICLVLSCVHFSLLNSLYAFGYLWANKGWPCNERINYIETNWPFFIGFGMPLSFVTILLPSYFESGSVRISLYWCGSFIYAVLFPLFVISAMEASPVRLKGHVPPLRLFKFVDWLCSALFTKILRR